MPTDSATRWLRQQPLAFQLAGVEQVWQERADRLILVTDQLWAVGKFQHALDEVVKFAESAAETYERLSKSTDFSRFARARIRSIALGAIDHTAVVSAISVGALDGIDARPLFSACRRLGVEI